MNVLICLQIFALVASTLVMPKIVIAPVIADTSLVTPAQIHAAFASAAEPLTGLQGLPVAANRALPQKKDPVNIGVSVQAQSALVIDRTSGAVLFMKDADKVHSIASLTKLMTALVVMDTKPDLKKEVTLQSDDMRGYAVEYMLPGDTVTVQDLLNVSLVESSNTATAALARSTGLSKQEFLDRMNQKAKDLGTEYTHFADPTGLDSDNKGSAKDVARIVQAALQNKKIESVVATQTYTFVAKSSNGDHSRTVRSTDLLLGGMLNRGDYHIVGGKTGTLGEETGYHVALAVASEKKHRDILVVVLGSDSQIGRFQDAKALAVWSFDSYLWNDEVSVAQ